MKHIEDRYRIALEPKVLRELDAFRGDVAKAMKQAEGREDAPA